MRGPLNADSGMLPARRAAAFGALVVVIGATFLPWVTGANSIVGTQTGEGQIVALASLGTMALAQIGWRPAWIGAGFIAATVGRQLLELGADSGIGILLALAAALVAASVMIFDMFARIERPDVEH